jgi:hypothetical protein
VEIDAAITASHTMIGARLLVALLAFPVLVREAAAAP